MGTTPRKLKTWRVQKDLVVGPVSGAGFDQGVAYSWIAGMLAAGTGAPTCSGSANASAHGMDGVNRIASSTDWVQGTSWIVIRFGNGAELLMGAGITQYNNRITLRYSPSAHFTGGNHSGTYPSATDEVVIRADQGWNNGEGAVSQTAHSHVWQSTDGTCTRIVYYKTAGSGGAATNLQCWLSIDTPKGPPTGWTVPIAVLFSTTGFNSTDANSVANVAQAAVGFATINTVACAWNCSTVSALATAYLEPVRQTGANDVSSDWQANPIGISVETASRRGYYGQLNDLWFTGTAAVDGVVYPADTSRQLIQMGGMILPWDGTARSPDTKHPIDIAVLDMGAGKDLVAPTCTVTPSDTTNLSPLDQVVFAFADNGDELLSGSLSVHASFDGEDSWEPIVRGGVIDKRYAPASTLAGSTFTIKRPAGWPSKGVVFDVFGVDQDGNQVVLA